LVCETQTPDASLANAISVMALYREHGELPYAAQALSDLEAKSSNAMAAYDTQQAGRVAVQEKQRELQSIAAAAGGAGEAPQGAAPAYWVESVRLPAAARRHRPRRCGRARRDDAGDGGRRGEPGRHEAVSEASKAVQGKCAVAW
jgi:hypothetical protein